MGQSTGSPGTESKLHDDSPSKQATHIPDSPITQKDMFGIQMNENTNKRQSMTDQSSPYQTEGLSTEFKQTSHDK